MPVSNSPFFELEDDLHTRGRWYLNRLTDCNGVELDSREFQYGKVVDLGPPIEAKTWKEGIQVAAQPPLKVMLDPKREGLPLDFTFTNANMPVAVSKVAETLAIVSARDIQRVPVLVEFREEQYEIINVISIIDCIDAQRSEITYYTKESTVRPDMAGEPEMILNLTIDPAKVGNHHIFRLKGWTMVIVVSEVIKDAFESMKVSGVTFRQISDW
jgi:hypothetical protein